MMARSPRSIFILFPLVILGVWGMYHQWTRSIISLHYEGKYSTVDSHGQDSESSIDQSSDQSENYKIPSLEEILQRELDLNAREALLVEQERAWQQGHHMRNQTKSVDPSEANLATKKDLISYVYVETEAARRNLRFFIQHGLYSSADFIFTFNGETDAYKLLPNHPNSPWYDPKLRNIEVIRRENTCLDFGAHGEALLREWSADGKTLQSMGREHMGGKRFFEDYKRFILMNASVRGPFLPYWSKNCWSEAFWGRITEKVKLVGMSYNCHVDQGHVQSMVWALDRTGIEVIMQHPPAGVGYWCPIDMIDAIYGETRTTPTIRAAGYDVDVLTYVYHLSDGDDSDADGRPDHSPSRYLQSCDTDDFFHEGAYHGFNVHPYETIFMKSARDMQVALLGNLTEWVDGSGYESYGVCDNYIQNC